MIRPDVQFVTAVFRIQEAIESARTVMIPVVSRLRLGLEIGAQRTVSLAQVLTGSTARRKYARLVECVARIAEILLLVALALISSGIDLLAATTTETHPGEAQAAHTGAAEIEDLPQLGELFDRAAQIDPAAVQSPALLADELPELPELFAQAQQITSTTDQPQCNTLDLHLPLAQSLLPLKTPTAAAVNSRELEQGCTTPLDDGPVELALEPHDFATLTEAELIAQAKAARFPEAKKWANNRKLSPGAKHRAIAFLMQLP